MRDGEPAQILERERDELGHRDVGGEPGRDFRLSRRVGRHAMPSIADAEPLAIYACSERPHVKEGFPVRHSQPAVPNRAILIRRCEFSSDTKIHNTLKDVYV
ncbi:MAG: hypothetical protein ACXWNH_19235 [Vulcanimicrobiaceae bacterium]